MTNHPRHGLPAAAQEVFFSWWSALQSDTVQGQLKADRATLKRAGTLLAVACSPAYQRVYAKIAPSIEGIEGRPFLQERLSALIGLAAHVTARSDKSLPQACSRTSDDDPNPVSDLRFARLLEAPDMEALFAGLRRTLPLIEHTVNPTSLANDVFAWGDGVRKRWAYDYRWSGKS